MANRIVSWGGNEPIIPPNPSKTHSIVSADSILQDKHDTSPPVQPEGASYVAVSWAMNMAPQVIGSSGTETSTSTSTYPGANATDGSFTRHPKYFFKDGNVAFLVENTLYCVHRYFFSRDSIYFSTRFAHLDIRDHEPLPTIISLGDVERNDFDAFLSVLYPDDFEENHFSYEEWKSVLHLSTRWGFAPIRKLALASIGPPTPHDRLLLARTYSVDDWVIPALSELCERRTPLTLSEARQMSIEDVVLVSTVREDIRSHALHVDSAEIPLRVEAEQLGALGLEIPIYLRFPKCEASSTVELKRVSAQGGDVELSAEEDSPGNTGVLKGEPMRFIENSQGVVAARAVGTGAGPWMADSIGIKPGDLKEDDNDIAVTESTPNPESPAACASEKPASVTHMSGSDASSKLPSYPVGRGIIFPFNQTLPRCGVGMCRCSALITKTRRSDPSKTGFLCLSHGLDVTTAARDLVFSQPQGKKNLYTFISPQHEAAIRAFLA